MISHMRDFLAKTKLRIHPDPTTWATYINLLDLKGKLGEDAGMPELRPPFEPYCTTGESLTWRFSRSGLSGTPYRGATG